MPAFGDRPNVLSVMAAQQRADSFGPGRHACADYPNLEALAGQSVVFDRMYCAASPCVPSRASFLTGRHPWQVGVSSNAKFLMDGATTRSEERRVGKERRSRGA